MGFKGIMMQDYHDTCIQAINNTKKVFLTYYSGIKRFYLTRLCVPIQYNPPNERGDSELYYFLDEQADANERMLVLPPSQIQFMELSDEDYNPAEYSGFYHFI